MFFVYVAFLTFVHVFRMVKMNIALVAIMLLATSMSKTYLTKTGSKRYLIKIGGAKHKTRNIRTTSILTKIEDDLDDLDDDADHLGQGDDEVCVINILVCGWFLISRIF